MIEADLTKLLSVLATLRVHPNPLTPDEPLREDSQGANAWIDRVANALLAQEEALTKIADKDLTRAIGNPGGLKYTQGYTSAVNYLGDIAQRALREQK